MLSIASKLVFCQEIPRFEKETYVYYSYVVVRYSLGDDIWHEQYFDKNTSVLLKEETYVKNVYTRNGTSKSYYPNGKLKSISNSLLGIPIGLYITFYENGNIKTLYDYGYSPTDIHLQRTEYYSVKSDSITNEEIGDGYSTYKPKNGKKYVYSEDGVLIEVIEYFDDKCLRVLFYDKNGNTTVKECPKELD